MAFIDQDLEDDELNQGQGGQPQVGGSSSIVGGTGGSSAGQGAGAGGGFTNIQAYLNANKGDTGSGQALSNTVNSQFNQERDKFAADSSKFLTDAQNQAKQNYIAEPDAQKLIDQAAGLYRYDNKGTTGGKTTFGPGEGSQEKVTPGQEQTPVDYGNNYSYDDITKKFQNALTAQYSGPKEYNYGFDTKTQNYGSALKDNASFDNLMTDVYSNAAKTPLTSGQYQLQKQFDVNNESLANARQNLSGSFDQLTKDRDKTVADTTAGLGATEQSYRENQTKLNDFLNNRTNDYDQQISQAESDARAQYNNQFKTEKSARNNALSGYVPDNSPQLRDLGVWGNDGKNITWEQLQNEQNQVTDPRGSAYYNDIRRGDSSYAAVRDQKDKWKGNIDALNDFYFASDNKYANTADNEERAYNAIQDFLNSGKAKKEQGFKVRG